MPQTSFFKPLSSPIQNTSTPTTTGNQLAPTTKNSGAFGGLSTNSFNFGGASTQAPQLPTISTGPFGGISQSLQDSANYAQNSVKPTFSGGVTFNPSAAASYTKPAAPATTPVPAAQSPASGLSQYIIGNQSTSNGGTVSTSGGNVNGYTPNPGYSIDTSNIPSNAINGSATAAGLLQSHGSYSDYVNALSQAQGYSPDYINALQGQYGAQTQGAQLGLNSAMLNSNLYTGNDLPGETMDYAQGATAKAQAQNTLGQAQNSIQQLSANQALNTAQLARTGNISAAQTQLQYSPEGMAGQNAIQQYNSLQQSYPGANIPEYNQSLTPEQNQQVASYIVANSPAYRSQFQQQYSTAAGGTGIYNKLDTGGLQTNSDGTLSLVSDAAKALGSGQAASVQSNIDTYNKLAPAYKAANDDFSYITNFMQSAGLNQSNIPAINQVQNAVNSKLLDPGAVATFKSAIASLRSNYANLLAARTGSVQGVNDEASQLIPDNLTVAQLQQVQGALNANGQNILNATQQQIQQGLSSLSGNASFTGNSQVPTGGSLYDF